MDDRDAVGILMVDDEPANLLALEAVLAPLKQRLVRAGSGNEALRHLLTDDFAVILMDVRMPGMSGFDCAAMIRSRPRSRSTPIIFLTGSEQGESAIFEGYSAGAVDYLMKPAVPEVLRSKVSVFVELAQSHRRLQQQVREREAAALELRQLNLLLEQRNGELASANDELDTFCAAVSHDLRNPLSQIMGFAQLLQMSASPRLTEAERGQLTLILGVGRRMSEMVTDFLAFSRLGSTPLKLASVDMDGLARSVIEDLGEQWHGRNVEWNVGALPAAMGDDHMLRQVWTNLISNAVKYSRRSDPSRITVAGQLVGGELVYSVADNGVGFDPKQAARLFAAFSRLHSETEFEGTGIGLSSVKRIVHKHGGRVWAEANPGGGGLFHFALPAGDVAQRI
ncbi:MAG: hybrid sensor histidine kinase/response regulator [Aquabacterium sp.]|jgi:two-component system sensor histidine kinase/response regulator|nr:MAG: hybrid sensor histidine kinase/response regulator [Aquabacterium sp.]TAL19991.1 MAG: hybrid sensor histidine kinase/response regulator [Aquabacterium sp.]